MEGGSEGGRKIERKRGRERGGCYAVLDKDYLKDFMAPNILKNHTDFP